MTAAWREFLRGTAMINRAKDYGLAHPGATEEQTLTALKSDPAMDNGLYVRTGLFLAAREREDEPLARTRPSGLDAAPDSSRKVQR